MSRWLEPCAEKQYLDLLAALMNADDKDDRTGTGTNEIFCHSMRFDLSRGFPLLTTKKLHFKSIVVELLWFLQGRTNNSWLTERGVSIWNEWATKEKCAKFGREENDLGPIYGHQWRSFGGDKTYNGFDQISWVINEIKVNPNSRRLIVSSWNPLEANNVDLPPCHTLFQFQVQSGRLNCVLHQRSADVFLGVPFNIASYALLTMIIAKECGLAPGEFVWNGVCVHLYKNHIDQARIQLSRQMKKLPTVKINSDKRFDELTFDDFELLGYDPHPAIKADVAI